MSKTNQKMIQSQSRSQLTTVAQAGVADHQPERQHHSYSKLSREPSVRIYMPGQVYANQAVTAEPFEQYWKNHRALDDSYRTLVILRRQWGVR